MEERDSEICDLKHQNAILKTHMDRLNKTIAEKELRYQQQSQVISEMQQQFKKEIADF